MIKAINYFLNSRNKFYDSKKIRTKKTPISYDIGAFLHTATLTCITVHYSYGVNITIACTFFI